MFTNMSTEVDFFLKKVFIKLKEIFIQKENPLFNTFYSDEEKGFEIFKDHVKGDETLRWINNSENLTDEKVLNTANDIIYKINRLYYLSKQ